MLTFVRAKKGSNLLFGLVSAALLAGLAAGCSETVAQRPASVQAEGGQLSPAVTGFFGADSSKLRPGGKDQAAMVYLKPGVNWKQYDKVLIEPVEFWDSAHSSVSPSDQETLTSYGYNQLKQNLQQHFAIVNQKGPGVIVLRTALIDATAATPGLRSASVIIPQARLLNRLQSLGSGSLAFVGSAEGEMKLTDAMTGDLLAGGIDKRVGGAAVSSAAQWKWGDAENAMNYWAQKVTSRLLELQGRTPTPQ